MSLLISWAGSALHHPMLSLSVLVVGAVLLAAHWNKMWGQAAVLALYLAVINIAALKTSSRAVKSPYTGDHHVDYVASRPLVKNTLLTKAYLHEPENLPPGYFWSLPPEADYEGQYLSRDVGAGEDIDPAALVNKPVVPPDARAFPIPDGSEMSKLLDAGAQVQWCREDGDCIPGTARVEAMVCTDSTRAHCYILVTPGKAIESKITSKHQIRIASLQ